MIKKTSFRGGPSIPPAAAAPSQSSQTTQPWAPLQPYLQQGYGQAANAFAQGPAQYTPFSQVANLTPDQRAQIQGTNAYVNAPSTQAMLSNQSNAVQNLMTNANNPYTPATNVTNPSLAGYLSNNNLNDPSGGINRFMYQNTSDPALQQQISGGLNQVDAALGGGKGLLQNQFGFGQNLAQNLADIGKTNTTNQAFGNAYDMQNQQRQNAINMANGINNQKAGLNANLLQNAGDYATKSANLGFSQYPNAIQAPLSLLDQLNQMGGINQAQTQAQIQDATNRWQTAQQALKPPWDREANGTLAQNRGPITLPLAQLSRQPERVTACWA